MTLCEKLRFFGVDNLEIPMPNTKDLKLFIQKNYWDKKENQELGTYYLVEIIDSEGEAKKTLENTLQDNTNFDDILKHIKVSKIVLKNW